MSEDIPSLSETLTDAEIAKILEEQSLESSAENIDLVRISRKEVEKRLKELDEGKSSEQIINEVGINSLHKN
jgi:hypothetical protein